jgi:opacity protein-like surface antigen
MMKKTKLALGVIAATVAMASLLVAPQAQAHSKAKKHSYTSSRALTHSSASSAERLAAAANNRVEALEAQLQSMQYELQALRSEGRAAPSADSAKVQELDQWMNSVKAEPASSKSKNNMVFFRGGYAHADSLRGGTLDPTAAGGNSGGALNGPIGSQDAWYFGAGFDWSLNDNLFGMMSGTEVFAELMFDYKELGEKQPNGITTAIGTAEGLPVPGVNTQSATVNQLTLAASPKIKFFKGQAFRPWLVPVGFELSVISPPSDAITVLNPGMQFGLGADYKIWKDLFVGADARYHYAPDNIDGVNTNGVTAGGYVGIGF